YLRESNPGAPYVVTVQVTDPRGVTTPVNTTATVLSNDIVTSVADSGPGSLRAVILDVNADQIPTAVRFNIPGPGPHRIPPAAVPNFQGVLLLGSPRNLIGGSVPGAGNVISGNISAGVQIFNDATVFNGRPLCTPPGVATGNVLQGNRIGTNAAGTGRLGNSQ